MMERPRRKTKRKTNLDPKKGQAIKKKLMMVMLFILGALMIYHPIKNFAVSKMVKYGTAEWKVLGQCVSEEGVLIRDETLIAAPADGEFEPVVAEGEKVAVGRTIGYVKTQAATANADLIKVPVKAPSAGLVSYHPDGLEDLLEPEMLNKLDLDKIAELLAEKKDAAVTFPKAESGRPICKIVDNLLNPYLYIQCELGTAGIALEKGQEMTVQFSDQITRKIVVRDVKKNGDQWVLMAEVFNAPDVDLKNRFVSVNVISDFYEGVAVSKEALVQEKGENGLYISKKGVCQWVKVEVAGYVGEEAVISGLDVGSQYIINPSLVRPGQRID